jgi:acetolactate synthase I/II/III large subunit
LFSHDALAGSVGPDSQPALYPTRFYPPSPADPALVAATAERILEAERPVLIAGNGVRIAQAYEELRAVAELAGVLDDEQAKPAPDPDPGMPAATRPRLQF